MFLTFSDQLCDFCHLWLTAAGFVLVLSSLRSDQGFPEVVGWLDEVEPLLYCTPLLSVKPRTRPLVNITAAFTKPWNTQQVKRHTGLPPDLRSVLMVLVVLHLETVGGAKSNIK